MPNDFKLKFNLNSTKEMEDDVSESTPRRATRTRNKPQKYGEFIETTPTKRRVYSEVDDSEEEETDMQAQPKPTALFGNEDVEGQDIFKFKSRHTKNDLQNKVLSAINSSPKPIESPLRTPKKIGRLSLKQTEATPRHVKEIIKKRIIQEVDSDSDQSDFSGGSSSDFVPEDGLSEESQSAASSSDGSGSEEEEAKEQPKSKKDIKPQTVKKINRTKPKDSEYIVSTDNYFMMNSTKKIATSDHTLARLKNMNLNENDVSVELSKEHQAKIIELNKSYEHLFDKWLYVLSEDFNIVLYGVGSKRSILHEFQKQKLGDFPCIVVNGFFPSLTIKNILETIVIDLLENTHVPSNISDVVSLIDSQLTENDAELFLIIHNIDGPMLRSAKAQAALASLSQIKNIHTIASIDHINAPLLWDHSKISKFRFTWWDVTTFLPYSEETSFENSLMTHRSGVLQLSSLRSVHQSLTSNAKGIFNIIIEYQLENQKQTHYQGLPFKELYSKSRERFLVSSDLALRAQLTEFLDHKLVKMKRSYDGSENLIIPIDSALLQQFLEQNS